MANKKNATSLLKPSHSPKQSRLLIPSGKLFHAGHLRGVLPNDLSTDEVDPRTGKVLSAVNDPLEERDGDDDGERDDAVV